MYRKKAGKRVKESHLQYHSSLMPIELSKQTRQTSRDANGRSEHLL